ncbi:hypothetical protein QQ045_016674 [Rhodiola kirilowii]
MTKKEMMEKMKSEYERVRKEAVAEVEKRVKSEMAVVVNKLKKEADEKLKLLVEDGMKDLVKQNAQLRRRNIELKREWETEKIRACVKECFMNKAVKEKEEAERQVMELQPKLTNQGILNLFYPHFG